MSQSERIERMMKHCRNCRYGEPLIAALSEYLMGRQPASVVLQELAFQRTKQGYMSEGAYIQFPGSDPEVFDEIDRRIIDLAIADQRAADLWWQISYQPSAPALYTYLINNGFSEHQVLTQIASRITQAVDQYNEPTPMGWLLTRHLGANFPHVFQTIQQYQHASQEYLVLVKLLLAMDPPELELAWQVAQFLIANNKSGYLGEIAVLLMNADPDRFTDWAELVAGPHGPGPKDPWDRLVALNALLERNLNRYIDLAVAAAQTPVPTYSYADTSLQQTGLTTAYKYDPETYWPLIEAAVLSQNDRYARCGIGLAVEAEVDKSRPLLQRVIAEGNADPAEFALRKLLAQPWLGLYGYLLSLLGHRVKEVRERAGNELIEQANPRLLDDVLPLLKHKTADGRLMAIKLVQQIGGERGLAALRERLEVEKSQKVKQVLLDIVGVPEADMPQTPQARLLAQVRATESQVGKSLPRWFAAATAPALRWTDGGEVPAEVGAFLVYRQSRHKVGWADLEQLDPIVREALPVLDRTSAGDWALALFGSWLANGAEAKTVSALPLAGALGDDRLAVRLRQKITEWVDGGRGSIAATAVYALMLIGSDYALAEIEHIAHKVKHKQVANAAKQAFAAAAQQLGIPQDELEDRIVPRLGLDERGELGLNYGPRQFTAKLHQDSSVTLHDGAGKKLASLPKPLAGDDAQLSRTAQEQLRTFKAQLRQTLKHQLERLERTLVVQRGWPVARWRQLFLDHPLLKQVATTLIWGVTGEDGTSSYSFRPLADGSLTDTDDEQVTLPTSGTIRLIHPIELDAETRDRWQQHLADYEATPPFPQLSRPVVNLDAALGEERWWTACDGYVINGGSLKGRYLKAGWHHGPVEDGGVYHTLWKTFPSAGIEAGIEFYGLPIGWEQGWTTALFKLGFFPVGNGGTYYRWSSEERALRLSQVPPLVFSEAAADVQAFMALGEQKEDWQQVVG